VEEGGVAAVAEGGVKARGRDAWEDPRPPDQTAAASAPVAVTRRPIRSQRPATTSSVPSAARK